MNATAPNISTAKWLPVKECPNCGKSRCTVTPDGMKCKCWRDGGRIIDLSSIKSKIGTGYIGKAHRKPAPSKAHPTADQAIKAAGISLDGMTLAVVYDYLNFKVARFEDDKGGKSFRPVHQQSDGWHVGDPAGPLALYHVDDLPSDAPIYVTEGEKACDAARSIALPAVTSAHGSSSAAKSNWKPIAERDVIILRDNDAPGEKYAADVSAQLLTLNPLAKVKTVLLPDLPDGGDVYDYIDARDSVDSSAIKTQIEQIADETPWASADDVEGALPSPVGATDLMRDYPTLKPFVIDGITRETETLNIIAASKVGKTHLAMALAVSVSTGRMWLEQYRVQRGKVLYIDCELHRETFARRLHGVCSAMGVMSDEIQGNLSVLNLRGKLRDIHALAPTFEQAKNQGYKLIILDALYRLLPAGTDENSNADATAIYNKLDFYANQTGAAIGVIHHSSKGGQAGKSVTDTGAGAGAIARAADSHFVLRQHEEDGAIVAEAALRSFAPIQPQCFRWDYPLWKPAPDLDPANLKTDRPRRQRKEETPQADAPQPWTIDRFVTEFIQDSAQTIDTILINAAAHELSATKTKQFLNAAIEAGKVYRWEFGPKKPHRFSTAEQPLIEGGGK